MEFNAQTLINYLHDLEASGEDLSKMHLCVTYKLDDAGDMISSFPLIGVQSNPVALGFNCGISEILDECGVSGIGGLNEYGDNHAQH